MHLYNHSKKAIQRGCDDFRFISLINHALKVFFRGIHKRIYTKSEKMSGDTQFGFIKGLCTGETLFRLKLLIQKFYDQERRLYTFQCLSKGIWYCETRSPIKKHRELVVEFTNIRMIKELYYQKTPEIKVTHEITTGKHNVLKVIPKGCILSSFLFSVYVGNFFK